jgi:hypothetical protein
MRYHKTQFAISMILMTLIASTLASCGARNDSSDLTGIPVLSTPTTEPTPTFTPLVPPSFNPLTGLPVADPSLLDLPALLVSISHFPVTARPQAGLSFAPWVFEVYITEGATRFLTTFYGSFPDPETTVNGDCPVRGEPLQQTSNMIGNRVWLDTNSNHMQDAWERGVGGVCVTLYDESGTPLAQTSTDSNGYYGFNVEAGRYILVFQKPAWMEFVQKDAGDENQDSDADPATGQTEAFDVSASLLHVDAGLILTSNPFPASELALRQSGTDPFGAVGLCGHCRLLPRFVPDLCVRLARGIGGIAAMFFCNT